MRSFWSDPYLWIHLAGLASLPLWLLLCMVGFAVGDPFLPVWLELGLVALVGVAPIVWMQWQRPFSIFSLVALALKSESLTEDQQRLLTLFKSQRNRILAVLAPIPLLVLLYQVYVLSPIAGGLAPFPPGLRLLGLGLAAIGFLGCNLFLQVPVSVLSVMLHSQTAFATTSPYPLEQIPQDFTLLGWQVNQILPPLLPEPEPTVVPAGAGEMESTVTTGEPDRAKTEAAGNEAEAIASSEVPLSDLPPDDPWETAEGENEMS